MTHFPVPRTEAPTGVKSFGFFKENLITQAHIRI
jgi:hypothetical protein